MTLGQGGDTEEDKELLGEGTRSNQRSRAQQSFLSLPKNRRTTCSIFPVLVRASVSPVLSALFQGGAPGGEIWWCLHLPEPG